MITRSMNILLTAALGLSLASIAQAQGVPYEYSHDIAGAIKRSNARIIIAPRLHPEVEVSRELAAQPVHPHMAKVILGGETATDAPSAGGQIQTYIDPLQHLHGSRGLDQNHSLVKAQRLHMAATGITTEQLHALRSHSERLEATLPRANQARIVAAPRAADAPNPQLMPRPIMIIPRPNQQAPTEYQPANDQRLMARLDMSSPSADSTPRADGVRN